MERRDAMIAMAAAASTAALGAGTAVAQTAQPAEGNALVNIAAPNPDAFIPGRFAGKTFIVTGSARGMGAGAALRLAREGANVVGVDWLKDLGEEADDAGGGVELSPTLSLGHGELG